MQERKIIFDKLRVIAMYGIVMIHMIYHCNMLESMERNSISYVLVETLYTLGFSMTNIFVLISSHLLIEKHLSRSEKIKFSKIINLCLITSFYSTFIYICMVISGMLPFSIKDFVECVFSVFVNQYWFIGTYIILYLLAPILTRMLDVLTRRELEMLIIFLLFFFSVLPTVMIFVPAQSLYDPYNGKSISWFVTMYIIVFYLQKYRTMVGNKISRKLKNTLVILIASILIMSRKVLFLVSNYLGLKGDGEGRLYFDSSLLIFAISCLIYLMVTESVRNEKVSGHNFLWVLVSQCTLSVYLIHNHPFFRVYLWQWCKAHFLNNGFVIILTLIIPAVIVIICALVDMSRKKVGIVFRTLRSGKNE